MSKRARRPFLGIDLGGTKILAVVIDASGKVLGRARSETKAHKGYAGVLRRVVRTVEEAAEDAGISLRRLGGAGIGAPGPVDEDGVLRFAVNLGWDQVPLARDLGKRLGLPVVLGNDVNCGGVGECTYGAGRKAGSAACAFVGTGLGGAVVVHGRMVAGAHGFGGEIGHIPAPHLSDAPCACGRRGCLETVASKVGIVRSIRTAKAKGMRCLIELPPASRGAHGAMLKSNELHRAYRAGCPATRHALTRAAEGLAWGLSTLSQIVDPEVFILGGGVCEALGSTLLPQVRTVMRGQTALYCREKPDLRLAELGDDAVAIGAGVLAARRED